MAIADKDGKKKKALPKVQEEPIKKDKEEKRAKATRKILAYLKDKKPD